MTRESDYQALTDNELEQRARETLGPLAGSELDQLTDTAGTGFTDSEVTGKGFRRDEIRSAEAHRFASRIERSGVLPMLEKWRTQDRGANHPGGRHNTIDDRAILTAVMILRSEQKPILLTNLTDLFFNRLSSHSYRELQVRLDQNPDTGDYHVDYLRWYHRVRRTLIRLIAPMDAWPGPRVMTTREERVHIVSLRDKNMQRLRQERAAEFNTAMLLMAIRSVAPELEDIYRDFALTVDQTALSVHSAEGTRKKDKKSRVEMAKIRKDGTEIARYVLEMDAGWYPLKTTNAPREDSDSHADTTKYAWNWALTTMAVNAGPDLPTQFFGASLNAPNTEIAEEALRPVHSILANGFTPSHLTGDRGYVQLGEENFQKPLRNMGVKPIFDYKSTQLGVKGGIAGSLQVEGDHYCPSTPKPLLNASVEHHDGIIDANEWHARIDERGQYLLRRKEKPDGRGHYPMMCPAFGPGATIECPLRDIHPKNSKKTKPVIRNKDLPVAPDHICTQTSVDFGPDADVKYGQALRYGTAKWEKTRTSDRQVIESLNDEIKSGPERLDHSASRRIRGAAAQAFIILTGLVQINFRRIATYLLELRRNKPKPSYPRRRDTQGLSDYVRKDRSADEGAILKVPDPPSRT